MREIKFRAWDEKESKMISHEELLERNCVMDFLLDYINPFVEMAREYKSDRTYMQYTGLKDKKGKEIYENDVVRGQLLDLEVTYSDNGEWLTGHVPLSKRYMNVEVLGNKFEGALENERCNND